MTAGFFKFPPTPHLALPGNIAVRADKVMTESECGVFLQGDIVVEEKVDGANLGISFDAQGNIKAQNRGSYIDRGSTGQWKKLEEWFFPRTEILFDVLGNQYILFGEWCYARHSIHYDRLPDWFLGFDILDRRTERFLCTRRRNDLLRRAQIEPAPFIADDHFDLVDLKNLLSDSRLSSEGAEGIYLRRDGPDWLEQRAKLVRPCFIQSVGQHWSQSAIEPNRLSIDEYRPARSASSRD